MSLKDFGSKIGFQLRKHTPEILTGTAIVTSVGALIVGIIKADDVKKKIEDHKARMKELHDDIDEMGEDLLPAERRRLVAAEYGKTAFEVGKELALPVALEAVSVGAIVAKYVDDKKRYTAVSTLLSATIAANNIYRKRVAEKIGEKEEKDLYYGIKEEEVEEIEIDEKGKEKKKKKKNKTYSLADPYAIVWEEGTSKYFNLYETNKLKYSFLEGVQRELNDRLIAKGYLSLAEAFDALGYTPYLEDPEMIRMAREVGWIYNKHDQVGDPYVKIGVGKDEQNSFDFRDGKDDFILLSFNCVGSIYGEIPKLFLDYVR